MAKIYSPLKWTGIKRKQAPEITLLFPNKITTYVEPFLGGGGVLMYLLNECQDKLEEGCQIIASDINSELIKIWTLIKEDPKKLIDKYTEYWVEYNTLPDGVLHTEDIICSKKERDTNEVCQHRKSVYYKYRDTYNKKFVNDGISDPCMFFCIMKMCFNGQIRYNSKGYLNAASQMTRACARPELTKELIMNASELLNKYNVTFINCSYDDYDVPDDAVMYLDPPYLTAGVDYSKDPFNFENFRIWVNSQVCHVYCSFDGNSVGDDIIFPQNKWTKSHICNGKSGFKLMNGINHKEDKRDDTYECLYVKKD